MKKTTIISLLFFMSFSFVGIGFTSCDKNISSTKDDVTNSDSTSVPQDTLHEENNTPTTSNNGKLAYQVNTDGTTCTIVGIGTYSDKKLDIPSSIDNYTVTAIAEKAFLQCNIITEATIPSSVNYIGLAPFLGCVNLKKINYYAAYSRPTAFYIDYYSNYIDNIDDYEFVETIVYGTETLYDRFFYDTPLIENLILSTGVKSPGENIFASASGVKNLTISETVTEIKEKAFVGLKATTISVDSNNPKYHSDNNCLIETNNKKLIAGSNSSIIPNDDSVTAIGYAAFGALEITSIVFPSSLERIEDMAFAGCANITEIVIPKNVTYIGKQAFTYCNLSSITVDNLNTIYYSVHNCLIERLTKTLVLGTANCIIPDDGSVEVIGYSAFYGVPIENLIMPTTIKEISDFAFYSALSEGTVIFYEGTLAEFTNISFGNYHSLTSSVVYLYAENISESMNPDLHYWHYVDGVPTVW